MKSLLPADHYDLFCVADPSFYESPERLNDRATRFAASDRPAPAGWMKRMDGMWIRLVPAGHLTPDQGWKVHVSATLPTAEKVIDIVWEFCAHERIPFKFLRSRASAILSNAKYAARGTSGKLVALYPRDERELSRVLRDLGRRLEGVPGPFILSDLRHGDGPLFVRYGAFRDMWCVTDDGERVPAIRTPDGDYVPDSRQPAFSPPSFVSLPKALVDDVRRQKGSGADLPYDVEGALHFSNGGGIYLARSRVDGARVVLREARPHAGLDADGLDAVARLKREAQVLRQLNGVDCVPRVFEERIVWEHHFLVEEFIEGETLLQTIISRHPLVHPAASVDALAAHAAWVDDVMEKVERALDEVHARGFCYGDLHPGNVILRPDGRVALVDWEFARRLDEEVGHRVGAPGFVAPDTAGGVEADRHGLECLRLMAFVPVVPIMSLDAGKGQTLVEAACREFDLSEQCRRRLRNGPWAKPGRPSCSDAAWQMFNEDPLDWPRIRDALVAGIHTAATPDRDDRLFPGDPLQFSQGGATLAFGASGVVLALWAAGETVPETYIDWIDEAADRSGAVKGQGLYDGLHGVALVLDLLGRRDRALELIGRAGAGRNVRSTGLFGGLAGIALNLLYFAAVAQDDAMRRAAIDIAEELARRFRDPGGVPGSPGLFTGATGLATLFLALHRETGDPDYLDRASAALRADLARCVVLPDGCMHVRNGTRHLPYLDGGTAGIALVLEQYLQHDHREDLALALEAIRNACAAPIAFQPGLFQGRAGLLPVLKHATESRQRASALQDQITRLGWHALVHNGHLAFPGTALRRLSMDLATGSAGILLSLQYVLAPHAFLLPFLTGSTTTVRLKGGESCLRS